MLVYFFSSLAILSARRILASCSPSILIGSHWLLNSVFVLIYRLKVLHWITHLLRRYQSSVFHYLCMLYIELTVNKNLD